MSLTEGDSAFTRSAALALAPTREAVRDPLLVPGLAHEAAVDPTLAVVTIAPDPAPGLGPAIADPALVALRNLVLDRTHETGRMTIETVFLSMLNK